MTTVAGVHLDVECPPDPDALCGCGAELGAHVPDDPDSTPGINWSCPGPYMESWGRRYVDFHLAAGETLDCPETTVCEICQVGMCNEHSNEFSTCVDGGIHHSDCADVCAPCVAARRDDAREDRAMEERKTA